MSISLFFITSMGGELVLELGFLYNGLMYEPVKDGIDRKVQAVVYNESKPPKALLEYVHCFWELKTSEALEEDFCYHVLPDACVNILFDQVNLDVAAITGLGSQAKTLNLGKSFHFVGVQLLPGVWRGHPEEIIRDLVDQPYEGSLPLLKVNQLMATLAFNEQQNYMIDLIQSFLDQELITLNMVVARVLKNLSSINSVSDMAEQAYLSPRQLQRVLKETVGFSPHDLLKILRVQKSFKQHYLNDYSDQSHFIHSFKKMTGYTPEKYNKKFNV